MIAQPTFLWVAVGEESWENLGRLDDGKEGEGKWGGGIGGRIGKAGRIGRETEGREDMGEKRKAGRVRKGKGGSGGKIWRKEITAQPLCFLCCF